MSDSDDVLAHLQRLKLAVDAAQMKLLFVLKLKELQSVEFSFIDRTAQAIQHVFSSRVFTSTMQKF